MEHDCQREGKDIVTKSYRRRWAIVMITMLFNVGGAFGKTYFGQVNDLYAEYFRVPLSAVDWLTISPSATGLVACIAIAWLATSRNVGLRVWCLTQCGVLALSYTALAASCLSRDLFAVALVAQLLLGVPVAIGFVSTPMIAVTWFPENEVGIAMGVHFAGFSAGLCMGLFFPTRLLFPEGTALPLEEAKLDSIYVFSSISAFFILLFAITYISLPNHPRIPPSKAQFMKRHNIIAVSKGESDTSDCLSVIRSLTSNGTLWLMALAYTLAFSNDAILFTLLSDIVEASKGEMTEESSAEEISSTAMAIYGISHLCAGIISGKVIASVKNLKLFTCLCYLCDFLSAIIVAGGIMLSKTFVLCIGLVLFGYGTTSSVLALMELCCQHMFPTNEIFVGSWLLLLGQSLSLISPLVFRQILTAFGYVPTVFARSALLLVGVFLVLFARPKYRRQDANSTAIIGETEKCLDFRNGA